MARSAMIANTFSNDLNPFVGPLANRLVQSTGRLGLALDPNGWELIQEMLEFAAEAEQQIVEQKQRIEELECLAQTDELTGLANRRGLMQALDNALARARRYNETGVIGYFDLNDFKPINDAYGHRAGDKALKQVAEILKSEIRANDIAARVGGDEFVVYLDHSDWKKGAARMHEIRSMISTMPLNYGGIEIPVFASLGVSPLGPESDTIQALAYADEAMYAEKRAGLTKLAV